MSLLASDQKAIIVAMDHARAHGVIEGLENPGQVIDDAVAAGADGIMTTFGVIKHYRDKLIGHIPTILRLDGGPSLYREDWLANTEWSLLHTIEDALLLGVNGVVLMAFIGIPIELETYRLVSRISAECLRVNLPLMVESLPCPSPRIPDAKSPEAMASAARLGFEHGADLLKSYYTGTPEGFRHVVRNCPVPVLIAGGPKVDTNQEVLEQVEGAMSAGAAGVVFGRNIWQSGQTQQMIGALRHIIHENGSVSEAVRHLKA